MVFVEDTLLLSNSLSHHGEVTTEEEELTPTLENFIVLTWLKLIHPELPKLVKQMYRKELTSQTLASIKPEISQALTSLLDKIRTADNIKILLLVTIVNLLAAEFHTRPNCPGRSSLLYKQAGCPDNAHFVSEFSIIQNRTASTSPKPGKLPTFLMIPQNLRPDPV